MQLTEKHRPSSLASVIGQRSTVAGLQTLLNRGMNSNAFYFYGLSGTGKTTIARALVAELKIDDRDVTMIGGADCLKASVQDIIQNFAYSAWGESQWKAVIVDECHAMSETAIQMWLPYLESLPARRLVIFTTTQAPKTDLYGEFSEPMLSRCKVFELKADRNAFAEHAAKIAQAENLNGQPIEAYRKLIQVCNGNLRAALQKIETGFMLNPEWPEIATESMSASVKPITGPKLASGGLSAEIAAELERGKKFFNGSKKHAAHLERLKELRGQNA